MAPDDMTKEHGAIDESEADAAARRGEGRARDIDNHLAMPIRDLAFFIVLVRVEKLRPWSQAPRAAPATGAHGGLVE